MKTSTFQQKKNVKRNRIREAEQQSRKKQKERRRKIKEEKGTGLELRGEEIKIESKKIRRETRKEEVQKRTKSVFNEDCPNILKDVYKFNIFQIFSVDYLHTHTLKIQK